MPKLKKEIEIAKASLKLLDWHKVVPIQSEEGTTLAHAAWLLSEVASGKMSDAARANRWIGYAHALMVVGGASTLNEIRRLVRFIDRKEAREEKEEREEKEKKGEEQ